ncbi:unnamed protein product [Closterium sp. Naga37s-1]|nr:unnamed protein product [Closterium sp. Naga37s-1]
MDALLLLPITDHPLALAAAAIFFFVSSDDVESDFRDPSHALSFLLALLKHHIAPCPPLIVESTKYPSHALSFLLALLKHHSAAAPPPAAPSPRPAPASAATRDKSLPARAGSPWQECPVKGGERREAEAAAAAECKVRKLFPRGGGGVMWDGEEEDGEGEGVREEEAKRGRVGGTGGGSAAGGPGDGGGGSSDVTVVALVLATLKRICSSVIALQAAPDNTLPPFSSGQPGRHQLMRVGLKDEMRRLGGLHLVAAVAARHMLQFSSLSTSTHEPRAGCLGAKEAEREAWGDAKRRRLGSKEHPFGLKKKHHLQQKHKRMGDAEAAAAANEGLTHGGRISTGVDVATSCLGVLEHVTFMSRDNQDYLIRLSLPTDTLPGAKRRKLSGCHTASPAAVPLRETAALSGAKGKGNGVSMSERSFVALLLECLEHLAGGGAVQSSRGKESASTSGTDSEGDEGRAVGGAVGASGGGKVILGDSVPLGLGREEGSEEGEEGSGEDEKGSGRNGGKRVCGVAAKGKSGGGRRGVQASGKERASADPFSFDPWEEEGAGRVAGRVAARVAVRAGAGKSSSVDKGKHGKVAFNAGAGRSAVNQVMQKQEKIVMLGEAVEGDYDEEEEGWRHGKNGALPMEVRHGIGAVALGEDVSAEEEEDEEKEGEGEEDGERGLGFFMAHAGAGSRGGAIVLGEEIFEAPKKHFRPRTGAGSNGGAVILGEAVGEEQEGSDDEGLEDSDLSGRERHRRASAAVGGGSGLRERGDGGFGRSEGVGKDPYEFLMDSQVEEELLVGEDMLVGGEWGGMRGGDGCGQGRGGVCGSGIRLGEEVEGGSSGSDGECGGLRRQGVHGRKVQGKKGRHGEGEEYRLGQKKSRNGLSTRGDPSQGAFSGKSGGNRDGDGGGSCKETLTVRSRAGRRFVLAACKVLMNVTNHSAEGCRAVAGAHGIAVVASLAAACCSDRCWQHALASAGAPTCGGREKEGAARGEGWPWEGDGDVLVVLLGLIVNLVEADSDARSLLAAATCTRRKQGQLHSKQHRAREYSKYSTQQHKARGHSMQQHSATSSGSRGQEEAGRAEESVSMVSLLCAIFASRQKSSEQQKKLQLQPQQQQQKERQDFAANCQILERSSHEERSAAVVRGSEGAEEMGMAEQRRLAEREVEELQMSVLGQGEMVLQGAMVGGMGMMEGMGTGKEEMGKVMEEAVGSGEMVMSMMVQGAVEAEQLIMESHAALLLGLLAQHSEPVCRSICNQLPGSSLQPLAPVLQQFMAFHDSVGAVTDESRQLLRQVIVFCASHKRD